MYIFNNVAPVDEIKSKEANQNGRGRSKIANIYTSDLLLKCEKIS